MIRLIPSAGAALLLLAATASAQEPAPYTPSPAIAKLDHFLETVPDLIAAARQGAITTDRLLQARIHELEGQLQWSIDHPCENAANLDCVGAAGLATWRRLMTSQRKRQP